MYRPSAGVATGAGTIPVCARSHSPRAPLSGPPGDPHIGLAAGYFPCREGLGVGRRGIKEYRAGEALTLIALDREGKSLVCPSCGATKVARTPKRSAPAEAGRVTLQCDACGRHASYLSRTDLPPPERAPVEKH